MLCQKCYGSGRVMGQGMIFEDCNCYDQDDDKIQDSKKCVQIDKRTKEYREAIHKIMDESEVSKEEAEEMFHQEFYKVN